MIPKRVFWAATGYAAGLGSAWWVARHLRRAARRVRPDALAARVGHRLGSSVSQTRAALAAGLAEGRIAARERETELRLRYGLVGDGARTDGR